MAVTVARVLVVLASAAVAAGLASRLHASVLLAGACGAALGALVVWAEHRATRVPVDRLFWGAAGGGLGLLAGLAGGAAAGSLVPGGGPAMPGLIGVLGAYLGAAVAVRRSPDLEGVSARLFPRAARPPAVYKVLDTSAIIDGRIADVCERGFVDGVLVVPQFVLRELQLVADSGDALKRARGKRGFEVLQRLQRLPGIAVEISDRDVAGVADVDRKLIEVARALGGKVVTNDENLNTLAEVNGVAVLSVNALTAALKAPVLPGEVMHVQLLREGKEAGQGIGYLEDGTMVVVDQGRRHLGQRVDVTVTSVLQTSAGRMVFSRLRDPQAAAARGG
jgi:uncharacterized protein YacL